MSGIAGTYDPMDRPVDGAVVDALLAAIAHRGPDAREQYVSGRVGLGYVLLRTTPEARYERQPLASEDGAYVLVADARIDNRADLLSQLDFETPPERIPDSALILAAYARWGEDCVQHLIGDFAFALWDAHREHLFCARDHMGIRPFFYHVLPDGRVRFASELKALVAAADASLTLREERIVDLMLRVPSDPQATLYEGMYRLPPAHTLTVRADGEPMVRRYWTLAPADLPPMTDEAYVVRFKELFEEAVRCRMRRLTPVGADLSGGLDSSAVACVARDLLQREAPGTSLHTFSYRFDATPESDERAYAEEVLKQGGFEPYWLDGDARGPLTDLPYIYDQVIDDLVVGGMHYMIWATYAAAHRAGIRVMLNGFDGDTTVGHGEPYLHELARAGDWETFAREVTLLSRRHAGAEHRQPREQLFASVGELVRRYAYPELARLARTRNVIGFVRAVRQLSTHFTLSPYRLVRRFGPLFWKAAPPPPAAGHENEEFFRSDIIDRFDVARRREAIRKRKEAAADSVRAQQQAGFDVMMATQGLEAMDHYAAHWRLEVRLPFMDIRLIQFCLALPSRCSLREGWPRWILRKALAHTLPPVVCWRVGKARMFAANRRALLVHDRDMLVQLREDLHLLQPYLHIEYISDLVGKIEAIDLYQEELSPEAFVQVQRLMSLLCWLRARRVPSSQPADADVFVPEVVG